MDKFDTPAVQAHIDGIFALMGPGSMTLIHAKTKGEHRDELIASLKSTHGISVTPLRYQVGQVVEEFAGEGTRKVLITGVATYLRSSPQYVIEDVDPDSARDARWVDEGVLREKMIDRAAKATGLDAEAMFAAPTSDERVATQTDEAAEVSRAVRDAVEKGALRSPRATDLGGHGVDIGLFEGIRSATAELKSFDPTCGFVEDIAEVAKRQGIFATVSVTIDGRPPAEDVAPTGDQE